MGDKKQDISYHAHSDIEEEMQIIGGEELFADVDDYHETAEAEDILSEEDGEPAAEEAGEGEEEEYEESELEPELEESEEEPEEPVLEEVEEEPEGEGEEGPEEAAYKDSGEEWEEEVLEEDEEEIEEIEEEPEEELEEAEPEEESGEEEEEELTEAEKALRRHRRRKKIGIAFLSVLGVIAVIYLGISAYFYSHFYFNTKINGVTLSMKTASQVQNYMEGQVEDYKLTMLESDGGREIIDGNDISLEYVRDDSVEGLLKGQNPFLWITALWETPEIEASVGVEYDQEELEKVIEGLDCMKEEEQTPSVSAKPVFQETQFEIEEEQIGTEIDQEKFAEAVNTAISGFQSELDLTEAGCYILPKYTADSPEVAEARDTMNGYLGANITLDFTPHTEVVDSSAISQWVKVDDNMQVTFDQDAVRAYIASLAEKYDTYGKTRTFTTGYGNTVQIEGGSYGWQIDQEAEYNALTANIQNAETVTREPNYARRGATHEGNDFGTTYAEVDLTNQHMFYFKDGQCVMQTDIVTGNPNQGNATPQGVYSLAYKAMNQVLRGPKKEDGTYEWESPVTYWMPFNGGIGFHDANWQSAFGGSRYLTYGSHGCVNMPPSAAAELYNYIEAGIPVVCHY